MLAADQISEVGRLLCARFPFDAPLIFQFIKLVVFANFKTKMALFATHEVLIAKKARRDQSFRLTVIAGLLDGKISRPGPPPASRARRQWRRNFLFKHYDLLEMRSLV